jgi:DNA repair photolyase
MRRAPRPGICLSFLLSLRLGNLRMIPAPASIGTRKRSQLDLLPSLPVIQPGLTPLDRRARGTEFFSLPVRSVLNSPVATRMGFWSLNPYVGCEFGCTYCYARDTHRYVIERMGGQADQMDFERRILVKPDVADALTRTLDPAKLDGVPLVIGTATDPYQPAERRFRLTRRVLESLLGWRGLTLGLITKSPLVTRDLDVLKRLAERHDLTVNISLATLDARLARRLELRSPVPAARLRALAKLSGAGINAGLMLAPVIPCVTDGRAALDALFLAAKEAGARHVVGSALRLGPAARRRFLPHLAREFPELAERYARHYAGRQTADRAYREGLSHRLRALRRKYGFAADEPLRSVPDSATPEAQTVLL